MTIGQAFLVITGTVLVILAIGAFIGIPDDDDGWDDHEA